MKCYSTNRIGKITISGAIYRECDFEECLAFMAFKPLRVEHLAYRNSFELIGMSYLFDEISLGEEVPHYTLIVTVDENGDIEHVAADIL